jgi:hypothetical protein
MISALICVLALSTPVVRAAEVIRRPTSGIFGLKVGVISRMNIRGDLDLHTEIGSTGQVYTDFPIWRRLYFSTSFDFYYVEIVRQNDVMIEGSIGFKYLFKLPRANIQLRPGVAVGYSYLPEIGVMESTDYRTVRAFLEAQFPIDGRKSWVAEFVVLGAPTGGNGGLDLSYGPGFMLRAGLAFR